MASFKVTGLISNEQGLSNCCYMNPDSIAKLMSDYSDIILIPDEGIMCSITNTTYKCRYYYVRPCDEIPTGYIAIGLAQRRNCDLRINATCQVATYLPYPALLRSEIEILITNISMADYASKAIDNEAFSKYIKEIYKGHIFCNRDDFITTFQGQMYLVHINELVGSHIGTFDEHTHFRILRVSEHIAKYGVHGEPTHGEPTQPSILPRRSPRLATKPSISYKY
jgi:hypothetical protein